MVKIRNKPAWVPYTPAFTQIRPRNLRMHIGRRFCTFSRFGIGVSWVEIEDNKVWASYRFYRRKSMWRFIKLIFSNAEEIKTKTN